MLRRIQGKVAADDGSRDIQRPKRNTRHHHPRNRARVLFRNIRVDDPLKQQRNRHKRHRLENREQIPEEQLLAVAAKLTKVADVQIAFEWCKNAGQHWQ
jgi:hypothetical protein